MKRWILALLLGVECVFGASYQEVDEEFKQAQAGCAKNDGKSCYELGSFYEYTRYYESGKNPDGSAKFAKHMKIDCEKAMKFYKKACDLDDILGCSSLGYIYERGGCLNREGFVARDLSKAKFYFSLSCKLSGYTFDKACDQFNTLKRLGIH